MSTPRYALLALLPLASACGNVRYPVQQDGQPGDTTGSEAIDRRMPGVEASTASYPVDLLFMVDNSNSMEPKQQALTAAFPRLIEGLRHAKFGGKLPDLRIGVVSSDPGVGTSYTVPSCTAGGDGGKLQNKARLGACPVPRDPWISYNAGVTNIADGPVDPVERVKVAFSCIATLGTGGCGFEQPLESLRRALDPKLKVNPGFLRDEALLVIFLITDEDDCSVSDPTLLDPSATATYGDLNSYRCTRFGVACNESLSTVGAKTGCKPAGDKLHTTADYISFFSGLKPAGKVILAALAGPTSFVKVGQDGTSLLLEPSCQSSNGSAAPAVRVEAVVTGVGSGSFFNAGIDASEAPVSLNVCTLDLEPALRFLAKKIVATF